MYWLKWLTYLSLIDEHIILVEFSYNSFNATCGFITKTCFSKWEILLNWNIWNEWYNYQENTR
jgi:hypothetical protein